MLTIVAFDGNNVVPYQADIVVIQPGERVDFIIFTNRPADNYRINYLTTAIGDFSGVFKKILLKVLITNNQHKNHSLEICTDFVFIVIHFLSVMLVPF